MSPSRRQFCTALVGMTAKADRRIAGSFVNDSFSAGHRIRDRASIAAATRDERIPVVIVGGGIAGLSAAWRLNKRGFRDFVLLEMNDQAGGNARSGENEVSAYPWAAHYVPVPGPGAIHDPAGLFAWVGCTVAMPVWNERYLCFSPQERLYLYGKWQDGIEPAIGLSRSDRDQFQKLAALRCLRVPAAPGSSTIPMELGADESPHELDRHSFADWLRGNGIDSTMVLWYMNYCCRDDYGALASLLRLSVSWCALPLSSALTAEEEAIRLRRPVRQSAGSPANCCNAALSLPFVPDRTETISENRASGHAVSRTHRRRPLDCRRRDLRRAHVSRTLSDRRISSALEADSNTLSLAGRQSHRGSPAARGRHRREGVGQREWPISLPLGYVDAYATPGT